MTFNQLRKYLENDCPVTIDRAGEDLFLVTNCVSFQEAYLPVESKYSDFSLIHLFYEIGVPAPPHLRDETNKYRAFRITLKRFQVPAVEAEDENE